MSWLILICAGLAEVGFTTAMKLSHGFTRFWPSLGFVVASALSFWLLATAMQTIPLGTAYAVWTGIGALGTALIGIVAFKESANLARLACLLLLLVSIVGLKLVS
jgi:quaternary ammonium compound-resistance protein SugE